MTDRNRWHSNPLARTPAARAVGLALLLMYGLFELTVPAVGDVTQSLIFISAAVLLFRGRAFESMRVPLALLLASLAVQAVSWYFSPDHLAGAHPYPEFHRLSRWFFFVFIALWLLGDARKVFAFWSVCLAGFLLAPWITGGGWSEWYAGLSGQRVDFGVHNAAHTALFFGAGVLGLGVFLPRAVAASRRRAAHFIAWAAVFAVCLTGVLVTQTRGVWLGLASSGLLMLGLSLLALRRGLASSGFTRLGISLTAAVLVIVVALATSFSDVLQGRLSQSDTVADLLDTPLSEVPYDSVGIRVHSWAAAWPWIQERPWFGWGMNGSRRVWAESPDLPDALRSFGHLHNTYLDVLVQFGIAGLSVMLGAFAWLACIAVRAWRQGAIANDVFLFGIGFLIYWTVTNLFESFMFYSTGRFLFNAVAAGIVVFCWPAAAGARSVSPAAAAPPRTEEASRAA